MTIGQPFDFFVLVNVPYSVLYNSQEYGIHLHVQDSVQYNVKSRNYEKLIKIYKAMHNVVFNTVCSLSAV